MKPHIRLIYNNAYGRMFVCYRDNDIYQSEMGYGRTMKEAFKCWKARHPFLVLRNKIFGC